MKVNYAGPYFDEKESNSAKETIDDGWLVMGKKCKIFEKTFPSLFNKSLGVLTNSGSSANLLMVESLKASKKIKRNEQIITPVSGFPTTVNPIIQCGFEPIFCDIELETLNIDINSIPENKAKAIIFAHVLGNPANMDLVTQYIKTNNIELMEDCCDALGSKYKGKKLGSFGIMSSCSFYPAHHITAGEGGFVSTSDINIYNILNSLRGWGGDCFCSGKVRDTKNGACGNRFGNWIEAFPNEVFDHRYIYSNIGYNLKPIEVQGAFLLEQLKKLPEITKKRKENWHRLNKIFSKYEEFFIIHKARKDCDVNWFAFPCTVRDRSIFKRFDFCYALEEAGIQTRPYFAGNLLLQPAYKDITNLTMQERKDNFPIATRVMVDTFFLGVAPTITNEHMNYIEETVDKIIKKLTK